MDYAAMELVVADLRQAAVEAYKRVDALRAEADAAGDQVRAAAAEAYDIEQTAERLEKQIEVWKGTRV